jgi:small GTP-binding protein
MILMRVLNESQENLFKEERKLLNDLRLSLVPFGASQEDQQTLGQSIQQLDELFLLVVVGEFNAGKSALINALLGQKLLKEGVTPTTAQINILRYGETQERRVENEHIHILTAPIDLLSEINIVDTPGTNAVIREHEVITSEFVPRADLVLFITSSDRPFTESERTFLGLIRGWGKKVVVVLNKTDILQSEADLAEVQDYVAGNFRTHLGITPEIFPISARNALRAKLGEPALWQASQFEALEYYIRETLDESSRLRLKYLNPLGVGLHLTDKFLAITGERLGLLQEDVGRLQDVDSQLTLYKEDMQRDFNFRMSDIEKILYEMEQRGQDYFDETIRLPRVIDLLNRERIQKEFTQQVVADVPQRIEQKVNELIDWLVDSDLRQWQAVHEHLADRRRAHQERILGDPGIGSFHTDRERLIEGVGRQTQRVVETYDKTREAEAIADGAQTAVAALAAVEIGAVSLGTAVTILATTAAADATGILIASVIALLGFIIIPARKRQAKAEMREKIAAMREQLLHALRSQFEREIEHSLQKINEATAPYTRFVRAEQGKLQEAQTELSRVKLGLEDLKVKVDQVAISGGSTPSGR